MMRCVLKGVIVAVVFDIVTEIGIILCLNGLNGNYYIEAVAFYGVPVLLCAIVVLTATADKASRCLATLACSAVVCIVFTIVIDKLMRSYLVYERIIHGELSAGDGVGIVSLYMISIIAFIAGGIISLVITAVKSRRWKKIMDSEEYKKFEHDWRNMGQLDYMFGKKVKRVLYTSEMGDHEHCIFCSEKLSYLPGTRHEGYCTTDTKYTYWICPACYEEFKELFRWGRYDEDDKEGVS